MSVSIKNGLETIGSRVFISKGSTNDFQTDVLCVFEDTPTNEDNSHINSTKADDNCGSLSILVSFSRQFEAKTHSISSDTNDSGVNLSSSCHVQQKRQ